MTHRNNSAVIENEAAYESAIKRNIILNAQKTFCRTYEDHAAIIEFISKGRVYSNDGDVIGYRDGFIGSLAYAFNHYGKLTERQVEAVRKCIAKDEARRAEWKSKQAAKDAASEWIGEEGKRMTARLSCRKVVEFQGRSFSYYDSGITLIHIMEDANGNTVIYKGKNCILAEGEVGEVTFSVKEHGVRNGVKQTLIQRPKVKVFEIIV